MDKYILNPAGKNNFLNTRNTYNCMSANPIDCNNQVLPVYLYILEDMWEEQEIDQSNK